MAKKKKCPPCPKIAKWMTTFSDMNQLLMCFFVMLVSMATFEKTKIIEAFGLMQGSRYIFDTRATSSVQSDRMTLIQQMSSQESTQKSQESLESYIESQNLQEMISVVKTNKGFNVRILDSVLFRTGSYDLLPESRPILDKIAAVAADSPFYINVEGHTDDQPIGQFTVNNWDLSTNRALSVLKYMMGQGVTPSRLSASGFGEYHPILPNITSENRQQNRRVEINFISPEFYESNKNIFDDE